MPYGQKVQIRHPSPTGADRQAIAASQLAAEAALREMRAEFDGTLVLLKGLELSCRYPDPTDRPFGDVDILTDKPDRLQATLIGRGYDAGDRLPYGADHHHEAPLLHPRLPIVVEVHRSPGWLIGMTPPPLDALLAMTVPSATGIKGVRSFSSPVHAVYLAVHSWGHRPFWHHHDLDDIALLLDDTGAADEAARLARAWGVSRIWSHYRNAIAARAGVERPNTVVRVFGGSTTSAKSRSAGSNFLAHYAGRLFIDQPIWNLLDIFRKARKDLQPLAKRLRQRYVR